MHICTQQNDLLALKENKRPFSQRKVGVEQKLSALKTQINALKSTFKLEKMVFLDKVHTFLLNECLILKILGEENCCQKFP